MRAIWERWWYAEASGGGMPAWLTWTLTPLAWSYRALLALARQTSRSREIGCPVVSVGNLTLGGSGKTPLVIALVERLLGAGKRVCVLSRGYGRKTRGIRVVCGSSGPAADGFEVVGDEPLLIALRCPQAHVLVGEDRVRAGRLAVSRFSPDVVICDDAFQHWRLRRQLDIVAIHGRRGFGNGRVFPLGPLREPIRALERARLVVWTHAGEGPAPEPSGVQLPPGARVARCALAAVGLFQGAGLATPVPVPTEPVLALCGIAHPDGFFDTCRQVGLRIAATVALADHQPLSARGFGRIVAEIERRKIRAAVVTEKDWMRFRHLPWPVPLLALRVESRWMSERDAEVVEESLRAAGIVR